MSSLPPLTIAQGAVRAKLVDASQQDKLLVQQLLSYRVDGAQFMNLAGSWDGRASFFEFASATFPAGFVVRLYREFTRRGRKVNLVRKPLPAPLGPVKPVVDTFGDDPRYDYQMQTVDAILKYGQGIAQIATGGGKSRVAKLAHVRIGRPTLFLTTRSILMYQMRDAFVRDLGVPVAVYGDNEWSEREQLMSVGMVQTFAAMLAPPKAADPPDKQRMQLERSARAAALLARFELVIAEEAHEASSSNYYDVMGMCRSAHYRLALTATPFMKDSEQANLQLEAVSGPVLIRVSEELLIERGILAKPYFKFLDVTDPGGFCEVEETVVDPCSGKRRKVKTERAAKLYRSTPWQKAYEVGVAKGTQRNALIVREVATAVRYGLSAMVLVQHKAHGQRLAALLSDAGIACNFIRGEHSQDERAAAIAALKDGRIQCLIGSTILDVGVDVPAVGMVVLAGAGKAEVAVRQRIGRGLRAKRSGANVCFIVDFNDALNSHLRDHARERRLMIESTPGFAAGIVTEFPFEALGFVERAA